MFDYNNIVTDDELTITFKKAEDFETSGEIEAHENEVYIGTVKIEGATFSVESTIPENENRIFMQYKLWQTRPERTVGSQVEIEGKNLEELAEIYDELLTGCYILNRPGEIVSHGGKNGFASMLNWLRSTDFYVAPGSSIYHDSFPGGLLVHTLKVYNHVMSLLKLPEFKNVNPSSAAMVALVHDWCKIGLYQSYEKNVKNDKTGEWEKKAAYKRDQKGLPLGHGVTSMFLASKFFRLSGEEACAIRWHMGRWNVCDEEFNEYQMANEKFPLVHILQFADQLSITEYAN